MAKGAKKKVTGRPTRYKEEYCEQAYQLCLLGYTDEGLSKYFGVSERTINHWKSEFPQFLQSVRDGKEIADMDVVGELFRGAKDKVVIEQQAFKVKSVTWDDKGHRIEKETIEVVDVEKVIPADFRNQQFWLRNRQSLYWREKQETGFTDKEGNDIAPLLQIKIIEPKDE